MCILVNRNKPGADIMARPIAIVSDLRTWVAKW